MPSPLVGPSADPPDPLAEERELVARAKADLAEFRVLYERYFDKIYNYCYYRTFDRTVTEDLVGRIFMKAVEAFPRYEWKGLPFGAWLFRIAANQLKNHYRDRKPLVDIEQLSPAEASVQMTVDEDLTARQRGDAVAAALAALGDKCREALVLRFYEELAYRDIAARLRQTEAACKMRVKRCLETMRTNLAIDWPDLADS
jgi:RNA polymerase sigma-70 factor (ECF subfamily)